MSQNKKVVIVKKEDTTISCKILVHKFENGCNIVIHFCIPLWNVEDKVQQMQDKHIFWDFNNDKFHFVLWGVLQEFKTTLVNEFKINR
jgi:hypothetical protein